MKTSVDVFQIWNLKDLIEDEKEKYQKWMQSQKDPELKNFDNFGFDLQQKDWFLNQLLVVGFLVEKKNLPYHYVPLKFVSKNEERLNLIVVGVGVGVSVGVAAVQSLLRLIGQNCNS